MSFQFHHGVGPRECPARRLPCKNLPFAFKWITMTMLNTTNLICKICQGTDEEEEKLTDSIGN